MHFFWIDEWIYFVSFLWADTQPFLQRRKSARQTRAVDYVRDGWLRFMRRWGHSPRCTSRSFRESSRPRTARLRVSGLLSQYLVSIRARLSYHFPRLPRLQRRWLRRVSSTSSSRSYSFRVPKASAPFCTMRVRTWPIEVPNTPTF